MKSKNKSKKLGVEPISIFEEAKQHILKGKSLLDKVKEDELEKIKNGWKYVTSADGKTSVLRKPNKK